MSSTLCAFLVVVSVIVVGGGIFWVLINREVNRWSAERDKCMQEELELKFNVPRRRR